MRKLLVLVVMTSFVATVLFLLGLSDGNGAGGNRFVDLGNGTVRDTSTGLIWLKNANCFGTKAWQDAMDTAASLADGQCGLPMAQLLVIGACPQRRSGRPCLIRIIMARH